MCSRCSRRIRPKKKKRHSSRVYYVPSCCCAQHPGSVDGEVKFSGTVQVSPLDVAKVLFSKIEALKKMAS